MVFLWDLGQNKPEHKAIDVGQEKGLFFLRRRNNPVLKQHIPFHSKLNTNFIILSYHFC